LSLQESWRKVGDVPKFSYQALDVKGRKVEGEVVAASRQQALDDFAKIQYSILRLELVESISLDQARMVLTSRPVSLHTLALFTRQLATLMNAGVPVLRAIDSLRANSFDKHLTAVLGDVRNDVNSGHSFSRALGRQGSAFPQLYVSMIRAGEVGGAIGEILERLAAYLEREYGLLKKVQAATSYPALVFVACVGLTVFVVNFIFPTFVQLFEGLAVRLPWPTRAMIAITHLARDWNVVIPVIATILIAYFSFRAYVKTPLGRRQWHGLLLGLPYLGVLYQKISVARMCNTLSTMLESGIPMLQSITATAEAMDNVIMSDKIHDVGEALKTGVALSEPLEMTRGFPPMLVHMVRAGEESGQLPLMLKKMAFFLEEELEYYIAFLLSLLEPIMVLGMGIVVCFILLGVFLPVYSLVQQF
jgi:type IV pilus assembly protein PilC